MNKLWYKFWNFLEENEWDMFVIFVFIFGGIILAAVLGDVWRQHVVFVFNGSGLILLIN